MLSYLESLEPGGPTPFARAAGQLLARSGPPGITVVISDLLTTEWPRLVGLRSSGSDLTVLHILAEQDTTPELAGDLMLVDREDGERLTVSVTDEILETFAERVVVWQKEIQQRVRSSGGVYIPLGPETDIEDLLLTKWRESGILR
jgi:hypothetical protein